MKIASFFATVLFAVGLIFAAGASPASAQYAQSKIQDVQPSFQIAASDNKKSSSGYVSTDRCLKRGHKPCGRTCCAPGYRCGDGACYKRGVTGGTGTTSQPSQTQQQ